MIDTWAECFWQTNKFTPTKNSPWSTVGHFSVEAFLPERRFSKGNLCDTSKHKLYFPSDVGDLASLRVCRSTYVLNRIFRYKQKLTYEAVVLTLGHRVDRFLVWSPSHIVDASAKFRNNENLGFLGSGEQNSRVHFEQVSHSLCSLCSV